MTPAATATTSRTSPDMKKQKQWMNLPLSHEPRNFTIGDRGHKDIFWMGSNCIKVLTQGIMLLRRPPLGNGVLRSPFGVLYHPTGSPSGFLYHPSGYALGMIKKPLGGPLGMIKSPSGVHKIPYPSGGVDIISQNARV